MCDCETKLKKTFLQLVVLITRIALYPGVLNPNVASNSKNLLTWIKVSDFRQMDGIFAQNNTRFLADALDVKTGNREQKLRGNLMTVNWILTKQSPKSESRQRIFMNQKLFTAWLRES